MRWLLFMLVATLAPLFATDQSGTPVNVFRANDLKIVDGPRVESVSDKIAVIAWSTDVESSATVRYGIEQNDLKQRAAEKWGGKKAGGSVVHRVTLKNLLPATKYWFEVESGEGWHRSKAIAQSERRSFTTLSPGYKAHPPVAAPLAPANYIVAGPLAANVTDSSATIWWMGGTSRGVIEFGGSPQALHSKVAFNTRSVALRGLRGGSNYYFRLLDVNGNPLAEGSFQTEAADFAHEQFKITRGPTVEVVGNDTVTVAWSTNARSGSVVHYGSDSAKLERTAMAPWGQREHRVVIKGLKPGTKYFFQVESAQAEGTGRAAKSNVGPFQTVTEREYAMRNPDWQR